MAHSANDEPVREPRLTLQFDVIPTHAADVLEISMLSYHVPLIDCTAKVHYGWYERRGAVWRPDEGQS